MKPTEEYQELLEQARALQAALDETVEQMDRIGRGMLLHQMALDWAQTHPPSVDYQLMSVESVLAH